MTAKHTLFPLLVAQTTVPLGLEHAHLSRRSEIDTRDAKLQRGPTVPWPASWALENVTRRGSTFASPDDYREQGRRRSRTTALSVDRAKRSKGTWYLIEASAEPCQEQIKEHDS